LKPKKHVISTEGGAFAAAAERRRVQGPSATFMSNRFIEMAAAVPWESGKRPFVFHLFHGSFQISPGER
jgi:hypothetical protein